MATKQQKKFGKASRTCIKEAASWGAFGKCMKKHLGGRKRKKAKRSRRRSRR